MIQPLKKLAGQTAIYGISSIIGRLLNYFLVPLHTWIFNNPSQYGIVSEMYSYVAFLIVILTYGMETAFFRFSESEKDKNKVYSTTLISLFGTTTVFLFIMILFAQPIANFLRYPNNSEYVVWFALIVSLDALTSIPFAKLRAENKAKRFAMIRLINIGINIGFNLFFLLLCPYLHKQGYLTDFVELVYRGKVGIGYIFISNLIASFITFIMLLPEMIKINYSFDRSLWKKMINYALPLLVFGLAGIVNETLDRILIKYLLPEKVSMYQLGIYGACYKLSIMMLIFIQAFRYAAEPFFFSQAKDTNAKTIYADVMKYSVIILLFIFMGVMMYMDVVKYFIGKSFHEGLSIVPILLFAYIFYGVFYNLSIWYKLTNQTKFGAYLSILGAFITIGLNIWLIPVIGYKGSAWATFFCYFFMMLASYFIGQKYYPVKYDVKRIAGYVILALSLYVTSMFIKPESMMIRLFLYSFFLFLFAVFIIYREYGKMIRNKACK